ncbi:hypothetical protein SAMN05216553_114105 [Lentzea fradiae]|uniref:Uncharacterized protein n=1 Tax=Lentzea fradiae TaxID=200378 RepID=A0A1G7YR92_9PSEU|nr:hypothetical protein SAMN05216553_114105 [Lentzea fradiae]
MGADAFEPAELDHLTGDQERQHQLPRLHHGRTAPVGCAQGGTGDAQQVLVRAHRVRVRGVVPAPPALLGDRAPHALDGPGAELGAAAGARQQRHRPVDAGPGVLTDVGGGHQLGQLPVGQLRRRPQRLPVGEPELVEQLGAEAAVGVAASGELTARRARRSHGGTLTATRAGRERLMIRHGEEIRAKPCPWQLRRALTMVGHDNSTRTRELAPERAERVTGRGAGVTDRLNLTG